ncbi:MULTISPECIES: Imm5 family immunity protein [Pseudomonas]|uniref:Immunity protein Imm5 n=1 Tax=Pseudomonas fluorescens TaxID=294 RepID=A0A0F4TF73_PSEFL|nr:MULTISPECIES: Imm5 family immunity protein [Pseudomonas]KJZ43073.1 immunity protein Imm5 [Pseudomonas fluorescens]
MNKKSEVLVKRLLVEVKNSPSGELILPLRKLLWNTITVDEPDEVKRLILTKLDYICVNHGAAIWSHKFGSSQNLITVLTVALDTVEGKLSEVKALSIRDDFYVEVVENQEYEPDEYPAMFVGHAAANTIATATADFVFDPSDDRDDRDLDPDAFEPSFLMASAFAGGLDDSGDSELRRRFWEWYLSSAINQVV